MILDTAGHIIDLIAKANPDRTRSNLPDRTLKMTEEIGELAEAFLDSTSEKNRKKKTWEDVQEEAVDVMIVAIDIALTPMHAEFDQSHLVDFVEQNLHRINVGFGIGVAEISRLNAQVSLSGDERQRAEAAMMLTCFAFAINILVARLPDGQETSDHLVKWVEKKLKKWQKTRESLAM